MRATQAILITGASGFVGANLCEYFAAKAADKKHEVVAVVGPSHNDWRLRHLPSLRKVTLDLTSENDIHALIRELRPRAIFNCAAYGAYPSQTEVNRIYRVNFDAVRYLLDAVRGLEGFEAFIQAGTSSEYGINCKAPLETDPTLPDSDYAVSKVAASALLQFHAKKYGVPAWVFRLYSVYGPFEEASRLIPRLLTKAREGKLPPLVNPRISRDFIHTDDVSRAFETLLAKAGQLPKGAIYNIGRGECVTLEKLVAVARETFGIQEAPAWGSMPERHWDHPDWYSNPAKAKAEIGWEARTPLAQGLKSTLDWMNANPALVEAAERNSVLADGPKGAAR
ncbi:MAG: NAD-dependent epimerase/dehydratase family protein [Oligoflexia bacterium]|nr:NAD-dependent epimerase/dehydratase family protein [Oligoflexia bacterium]